jgi:putative flippase GtrA
VDLPDTAPDLDSERPELELVVPVHNEQQTLMPSVHRLHAYLGESFPYSVRVTIVDNASTDRTWELAERLAVELRGVRAVRLDGKGRGRALEHVWSRSDAVVLAYMDVDLSTDLRALLPLVAPLMTGHSDVAIGTRLARGSRVVRGPQREFISRCYNTLLHATLATRFTDAQCGFKAIRADAAHELLPLVENTNWFFDTELLVLAERAGMRIHEVPVDWVDDPDSRVDVIATAAEDLRGIVRLARGFLTGRLEVGAWRQAPHVERSLLGQLVPFAVVGVLSTLAYLLLFLLLAGPLGSQVANAAALLLTAVGNTAMNRRFTFGITGPQDRFRHQVQGLVAFGVGLALTSGSLALLHAAAPSASRGVELGALVVANVGATLVRFLLFRSWIFPSSHAAAPTATASPPTEPTRALRRAA